MSNQAFEIRVAKLSNNTLALLAQLRRVANETWEDERGSGYESVWNSLANPTDSPIDANATQSEMNNAISGLKNIIAAIEGVTPALSKLAEYDPDLLA